MTLPGLRHRSTGDDVEADLARPGERDVGHERMGDERRSDDLTAAHDAFIEADLALIDVTGSVDRRISPGGGSPDSVHAQAAALRQRIAEAASHLAPPAS